MKILVVDDEQDIRNLIKIYLSESNYEIIEASDGRQAVDLADDTIDLILMDVMMPRLDGVKACLQIRESYHMPIIFLTAKGEDADKLTAFSFGADDYIVKPFNPVDLVSRVKAQTRRYREYNKAQVTNGDVITLDDLSLDVASHMVTLEGKPVKLTKKEFDILALFLRHRGMVYSLEQIYEIVWGEDCIMNSESTVSVHIRNLRDKIEPDKSKPTFIKTVWGVGYRVDK